MRKFWKFIKELFLINRISKIKEARMAAGKKIYERYSPDVTYIKPIFEPYWYYGSPKSFFEFLVIIRENDHYIEKKVLANANGIIKEAYSKPI